MDNNKIFFAYNQTQKIFLLCSHKPSLPCEREGDRLRWWDSDKNDFYLSFCTMWRTESLRHSLKLVPPPFHKGGSVSAKLLDRFLYESHNRKRSPSLSQWRLGLCEHSKKIFVFDYKLKMFYCYPNLNFCTFLEMFLSYQKLDFYKFSNPQKHYFISRKLDLHEPPL